MFEYLMPLLLMRTLPGDAARQDVPHGRAAAGPTTAASGGVPWGISESAFNLVDRRGNYQYKAFGVPGLGLKRGLARRAGRRPLRHGARRARRPGGGRAELPAPRGRRAPRGRSATTTRSTTRLADRRRHGRAEARATRPASGPSGVVVRHFLAHHQGMTLVALANVLLGDVDGRPLPRGPAREGDGAAAAGAGAARGARHRAAPRRGDARGARRAPAPAAPPPLAAHALPERPDPLERQLRRRSSPTPAAARASAAAAPSPAGARTRPATRGASSSTCATSTRATSGPPRISPSARRPTTTWWSSSPRRRSSSAATTRSRRASRSPSRPRTTPRCGASR